MRCSQICYGSSMLISRSISYCSVRIRTQNSILIAESGKMSPSGRHYLDVSSTFPSRRYILCLPLVQTPFLLLNAIERKFFSMHCSRRSIVMSGSVDEGEVIKALDLLLSTEKEKKVSDKEICGAYIEKLCGSGNLSDAVHLLRYIHDRQIHLSLNIYNVLLKSAGEANNFSLFCKIFKYLLLSRFPPDLTSYINVAKAFQKVDDSELILKFIRVILEITNDRDPTVMNRIILLIAKSGQIDKSMMIFEELKNSHTKVDVVTFNTILGILGKAGRVNQMLSEFEVMKERGHAPDIVTYNTVINSLRRLGKLDLCKAFATEMFERGINLDLRTYTALIDGFGRAGHIEDALNMFGEMKKSQQPSIYVYRAVISDLKKAGKFELALKFSEEMNSNTSKLLGPEDFKTKSKVERA
ncbi:uncharacterized protein [Typha angustifolia]|uniref:uncharacterized protein isoform X1 n=1 Tax=Typha angustifolia TaxID=59011 RepID=UPI003C2AD8F5